MDVYDTYPLHEFRQIMRAHVTVSDPIDVPTFLIIH